MATVIDALVMTLGLDTRDYDRGQKTVDAGLDKTKKHADAVAKELTPQIWSTRQPWFAERLAALASKISSKTQR